MNLHTFSCREKKKQHVALHYHFCVFDTGILVNEKRKNNINRKNASETDQNENVLQ